MIKDNALQTCFAQAKLKLSIDYSALYRSGYNLYVFHIRYHGEFAAPQRIEVKFHFSPPLAAAVQSTGFALLLTNEIMSNNSDGQIYFDLISLQIYILR